MSIQLKKNITIIVSVIVVQNDTILMMQEAKPECFGLWYLPAGRLERYENLLEGVKREGLEETGLEIEPIALLCVEMKSLKWIRFNFIGKPIGGALKKKADKESLCADWVPISVVLNGGNKSWPLRAPDIVNVIGGFVSRGNNMVANNGTGILPRTVAHTNIQFRLVMRWGDNFLVEKSTKEAPITTASSHHSFESILNAFIKDNFMDSSIVSPAPFHILSLEFGGSSRQSGSIITDGFLFELIIGIKGKHELSPLATVEWCKLDQNTKILITNESGLPILILVH